MDFIEGEPLGKILEALPEPESGQDVSDRDHLPPNGKYPLGTGSARLSSDWFFIQDRPRHLRRLETLEA